MRAVVVVAAGVGAFSAAFDVNNRSEVVGYSDKPDGSTSIQAMGLNDRAAVVGFTDLGAFLWERGRLTPLPSLAGTTTSALDINDRGQIVGLGATTPDGLNLHAVLWTR